MLLVRLVAIVTIGAAAVAAGAQDGPALADRIAKLDEKLLATLADFAAAFDEMKDPEAAHFFAECALGLGSADAKLRDLQKKWENEIYYGRSRGGKVLEETAAIEKRLAPLAKEYRAIVDELVKTGTTSPLSDDARKQLHGCVVKAELARAAHEYIQATHRFNELRRAMKLRAILWDFESSSLFIKAAWYMAETGDYSSQAKSDEKSVYYSDAVATAKKSAARSPRGDLALSQHVHSLRALGLVRADLLNPDVRMLVLARWSGKTIENMVLYRIPRTVRRPDIATPSARHGRDTVAEDRDLWQDVEETVKIGDKKAIVAAYPYDGEPDSPTTFGDSERTELGWSDPAMPDQTRVGVPIMLRVFTSGVPSDVKVELRKDKGMPFACRVYVNGDKRVKLEDVATVLVVPERPLERGVTYAISVKAKLGETPFEKAWKFTTRK